jgi:amidase
LVLEKPISEEVYESYISHFKKELIENGFEKLMRDNDIDVILGPLDSRLCSVAGAARYPCGTLPLGFLDDTTKPFGAGRPFGMAVIAAPGQEGKIVQVMSAWESTVAKWSPPPQMLKL